MQPLHLTQAIVLKGFLMILIGCVCLTITHQVKAQTTVNPQQIVSLAKSGNVNGAANLIKSQINISPTEALNFAKGLQNGKIDVSSATNLVSGALGGKIDLSKIKDVSSMLQGLANGKADPAAISGLINQIAGGKLPPEVGKVLSGIQQLGALKDIKSISDVFKNPAITKAIADIGGKLGLPAEATKALGAISDITKLISDPKALLQNPAAAAAAITNVLKTFAPDLAKKLEGLVGGDLAKALSGLLGGSPTTTPPPGTPSPPPGSGSGCSATCSTCANCAPQIKKNHQMIRAHVTSEFEIHRQWIVTTYYLEHIGPSLMLMTNAFATAMMQQVQIIGTFFDAKHQLETQRLIQQLTAKAHKDYHPSESLCAIGTNVRSLASSERHANLSQTVLANRMMQRQLSTEGNISTASGLSDRESRVKMLIENFCRPTDGGIDKDGRTGLSLLCKGGGKNKKLLNMDVDYTSAIENKLTFDMDYTNNRTGPTTDDEKIIFAMSANLFANDVPSEVLDLLLLDDNDDPTAHADWYLDLRAIAAKRSVAQNSFAAITSLKAEGDDEVAPFLKAILKESGIKDDDIHARLGEKPSYFAQMEVMTKDLYQNPTFYSNLYDKPVNIERKATALQAIELMQDRDIYKSLLRSEAVMATLVETLLRKEHARVSRDLENVTGFAETGATP